MVRELMVSTEFVKKDIQDKILVGDYGLQRGK